MPIDQHQFEFVCSKAREAMMLQSSADLLEWDERTGMPIAAGEYRAQQVARLRGMAHQLRTDPAYGDQLQTLLHDLTDEPPHSPAAATIRELHRDWDRDQKLPTELVQRAAEATVRGQQSWDAAKKANDYSLFRNTLETIIAIQREIGQRLREGTNRNAYEALMDEYEPNANVDDLKSLFQTLRAPLVELVKQIQDAPRQPDAAVLRGNFSIGKQREFNHLVAEMIGFDFSRGRLDETSHPFCTTLGPHDCRILTRYDASCFTSGMFCTMHEAGHGIYEQGLPPDWFALPPGTYASLGIHESQSRLWENQVGRSLAFWQWLAPQVREAFAFDLDGVSLEAFHFAINKVEPSLIRVEADEATYNLHIIIRFDLEQQLIDGSLSVDDLPEAWNERYANDLGVRPESDADGVLQDVHWSAGLIGYFPTYALGNLMSAQLYAAAQQQLGDLETLFANGQFALLLNWLREKIHRHGRCYASHELIEAATGAPLSADHLVQYLQSKLKPLYGI